MSVPDSNNMEQIQCAEGDSGGEEREKEAEAGLRVGGRGIGRSRAGRRGDKGIGARARFSGRAPAAAEDGELVAGLVDGTVTIDALRNGESGAAGMSGGDDYVTNGGTKGFEAPLIIRADQIMDLGVRPPYFKFPRNPTD